VAIFEPWLIRTAAFAWSKACALGLGAGHVEGYVLAPRQARGTAWPAIHPRGLHGIEEQTVSRAIALADRLPALFIIA
jgi:hypothetical protein